MLLTKAILAADMSSSRWYFPAESFRFRRVSLQRDKENGCGVFVERRVKTCGRFGKRMVDLQHTNLNR